MVSVLRMWRWDDGWQNPSRGLFCSPLHLRLCFSLHFTFKHRISSSSYSGAQLHPMASSRRGALIVVEGLDRAGKSSQCECLRDSLLKSGHSVKYIRFPGNGDIFRIYMDIF